MSKIFLLLGELKSFSSEFSEQKKECFVQLIEEIKEESSLFIDENKKLEKELHQEKFYTFSNKINMKILLYITIFCNFLLFPLINFIAKCININAPQIEFEMEVLIKTLLPFFSTGG